MITPSSGARNGFHCLAFAMFFFVGLDSPELLGQAAKASKEKKQVYEDVFLRTSDGVKLKCRFYAGGRNKKTVPVMVVHGFGDQGGTYYQLAEALQTEDNGGIAVIVPDLRGHGESTEQSLTNGEVVDVLADKMRRPDMANIVTEDLVAVKKFLVERNNAGELNIDMLCVIAIDTGCVYGMNWIYRDWMRQQLVGYRRGRDPKAFVLISPQQTHMRMTIHGPLKHPVIRGELSAMLILGDKDSQSVSATRRIQQMLRPHHPSKFKTQEEQRRNQDLFVRTFDTSLSGGDLVNQASLGIASKIAAFIDLRLISHAEKYPWAVRENPLQQ